MFKMSNIDFQNGVALGLAMSGVVEGGGNASLNIAYGETAPEDTSKLWIKANEPNKLLYSNNIDGVESIKASGTNLPDDYFNHRAGVVKIETKFYLFRYKKVYVYDTSNNLVTDLGEILPEYLYDPFCYVKNGKIYLIGGNKKSNCYIFDPETNETTKFLSAEYTLYHYCGYGLVGDKLYCFGGRYTYKENTITVYDIETETFTVLSTTMPYSENTGYATVGTKIYLFGGGYERSGSKIISAIYVFDTETQTLSTLETKLPQALELISCAAIGTKIYLFGGKVGDPIYNTINVFDTETETIETLETVLPAATYAIACYTEGTQIYLFGGGAGNNSAINIFTLTHELAQGNIEIETSPVKNKFNLINTDNAQIEIGVKNVYIGNENNEAEVVEAYLHNGTEWVQI
jgi:N-acetylneuraminic acid mutarotase